MHLKLDPTRRALQLALVVLGMNGLPCDTERSKGEDDVSILHSAHGIFSVLRGSRPMLYVHGETR